MSGDIYILWPGGLACFWHYQILSHFTFLLFDIHHLPLICTNTTTQTAMKNTTIEGGTKVDPAEQ